MRTPEQLVRRLVDEVMVGGRIDVLPQLVVPDRVDARRRWVEPFRQSLPDLRMEIVAIVTDGDRVAGHFRCSATHLGPWLGYEPTGRRFEDVDELYFFDVRDGLLTRMRAVEDRGSRLAQLGLPVP